MRTRKLDSFSFYFSAGKEIEDKDALDGRCFLSCGVTEDFKFFLSFLIRS